MTRYKRYMETIRITKQQARRFLVRYHGLDGKRTFSEKQGIMDFITKVGCIQFDPLNIVGHNHELVLQARIKGFKPEQLQQLLYEERKLIDGWDKNMSIYCSKDWPYFRRLRESEKQRLGNSSRPINKVLTQIRKEIEDRGPLSSGDLEFNETVDWSWAPTSISRAALESMYFWGELVIHHKAYTRRIYDFASRLLPHELLYAPDPNLTDSQYFSWYVLRRLGGIGMLWNKAGDAWLGIDGLKSKERNEAFSTLLQTGAILEVSVEGMKQPLFIKSEYKELLDKVMNEERLSKKAVFLAPLDNLIWDRKLIGELFDFDYIWEVYKPATLRSYGYYVLPVLYGDRFIARFEPGWDKAGSKMLIKNWWWEPGIKKSEQLKKDLVKCLKEFAEYLNAEAISIDKNTLESAELEWLKI